MSGAINSICKTETYIKQTVNLLTLQDSITVDLDRNPVDRDIVILTTLNKSVARHGILDVLLHLVQAFVNLLFPFLLSYCLLIELIVCYVKVHSSVVQLRVEICQNTLHLPSNIISNLNYYSIICKHEHSCRTEIFQMTFEMCSTCYNQENLCFWFRSNRFRYLHAD